MKNGFLVFNVKKYAVPPDQHVGDVSKSGTCGTCIAKPVSQWNMNLPNAIANLANRGQVSLCSLFSTVVKDARTSRFSHAQG